MDLLARAAAGIAGLDADDALKRQAAHYLELWLTRPEFAAYRPQVEWLIVEEQWPGLLDRFCQILPFGTGGRRGAVGIGPSLSSASLMAARSPLTPFVALSRAHSHAPFSF